MAENTIYLRQGQGQRVQLEREVNAAFYPGHLIELMSTNKFRKHATAGGSVTPIMFAIEDTLQGKDISDGYAADDRAVCIIPQRGDFIQAVLKDGQNVAIGDKLESAANGVLQKHAADDSDDPNVAEQIVGIAMEALDISESSGEESDAGLINDVRIWIMVV
jgi:hypothetical protein